MTRRRDLLIAGACVAAAGGAYALTPRRRVSLLGADKLDDIVPRAFNQWTSVDMNDEVAPREEGSLASKLYGQTVGRLYTNAKTGAEVMLLLAWGDTQSNQLQVHRPEVCYAAFGYEVVASASSSVQLPDRRSLPVRTLLVRRADRTEQILYWTRLGDHFPTSISAQRLVRFQSAVAGTIVDGVLARFSAARTEGSSSSIDLAQFASEWVAAIRSDRRKALIGFGAGQDSGDHSRG